MKKAIYRATRKSAKKRYTKPMLSSELLNKYGKENFLAGSSYTCGKCMQTAPSGC